jgi:TolA-binding protein
VLPAALLALAATAAATPAQDAFYAASALEQAGRPAEAVAGWEAVAQRWPDDEIADDALAEAARVREEKLGDPEGALGRYQELLRRYPQSRLSRRAALRADFLRKNLVAGAEPLRLYQDVLARYPQRSHADSIARMEDLLRRFPTFPLSDQATLWLGEAYQQERRFDEALGAYRKVVSRWPETDAAGRAQKAIGDLWLERGQAGRARQAYDALARRGPAWAETANYGRKMASQLVRRRTLTWASVLVIVAFLVGYGLRATRGGRLTIPPELKYYLPVAGAFVAAALTEHRAILRATLILAATGLALALLVGQRPTRRGHAALHGVVIVAVVAAAFVLAVQTQGLTDMMLETLSSGAER